MQKPKRQPTAYNLYVKEQSEIYKAAGKPFNLTEIAKTWKNSNQYVMPKSYQKATLCRGLNNMNDCVLAKPNKYSQYNCVWTKQHKTERLITKGSQQGKITKSPKPHCAPPFKYIEEMRTLRDE